MTKINERLLLTTILAAALVLAGCGMALADSLDLVPAPDATANSVRNFSAVWKQKDGLWPNVLSSALGYFSDGWVDYNPTVGVVRPILPDAIVESERRTIDIADSEILIAGYSLFPQFYAPGGYVGFSLPDPLGADADPDSTEYAADQYVSLQPDPSATIVKATMSNDDPKYFHGLDYVHSEDDATDDLEGIKVPLALNECTAAVFKSAIKADGDLTQMIIAGRPEIDDDPGTPDDESRPKLPPTLITSRSPIWLVGVWADQDRTRPIKAKIVYASALDAAFPSIRVISLIDAKQLVPESRLYVDYYCAGTNYVVTTQFPLPMPYTVYQYTPINNTIKVNPNIVKLDNSAHDDTNDADPSDPSKPGPHNPILGIYDNPALNENSSGNNYWVPGNYEAPNAAHPNAGVINLQNMPSGGLSTVYVKVSTYAVDHVWDTPGGDQDGGTDHFADVNGNERQGWYSSKLGMIRLKQPLLDPQKDTVSGSGAKVFGRQVWVDYRHLSRTAFTTSRPFPAAAQKVIPHPIVSGYDYAQDPIFPLGTFGLQVDYSCYVSDDPVHGAVWLRGPGGSAIPMFWDPKSDTPASKAGATFRVSVSGGLNLSNPIHQPSDVWDENKPYLNNALIYDPNGRPMYYAPNMRGKAPDDPPTSTICSAIGATLSSKGEVEVLESGEVTVQTYSSRSYNGRPNAVDYGGSGDMDYLTCYPDGSGHAAWPEDYDVDPLSIEPIEESNSTAPDSGSGSTMFVFRCHYHNKPVGLPPKPWLRDGDDPWSWCKPTGVVLYLDENGTGDYRPHFMDLEKPDAGSGDPLYDVYIYRVIPHNVIGIQKELGDGPPGYPWQYWSAGGYDNQLYQSLFMGTYHYFFACSDDSLTFWDNPATFPFEHQGDPVEWGQDSNWYTRNSTGLDPSIERKVTGFDAIARTPNRRYSADGITNFDYTIYVDRPVRVPGFFEYPEFGEDYQWKSSQNPEVTCELRMPSYDDKYISYDDSAYGMGRFFGTINDFRRASNPAHRGNYTGSQYASQAETCGHESSQENVFRILYRSKYNEAPISIKVYINNASEKNNPETGNTPAHTYTAFTMQPRADQAKPYNYVTGVWYEYKTTSLSRGPHTYYFQAYDGRHVARFPVRPDHYDYCKYDRASSKITDSGSFVDWWVPTPSKAEERGTQTYYDNDYVPGPYINNPCVLTEAAVTPGTGKEGQQFQYKVKYSDPDGQRPYTTNIIIEVDDKGTTRTFAMAPETPIVPPNPDTATEDDWIAYRDMWKNGVYYVLDTATLGDLALQAGVRRYRFEFKDDWGRLRDVNDTVPGELIAYPQGSGNWVSGPVISGNIAPTLYRGSVESQDGTANAATLWTWHVTYRDVNNDEPKLIKLYIGVLQVDGRTIVWDEGHAMQKTDPSDMVYSDGVNYYYQSRLGAVDTVLGGTSESKQYYYAFESYDGVAWATYKSSSKDEERSNAAGCMFMQEMERLQTYTTSSHDTRYPYMVRPLLAQQGDVNSDGSYVSATNWDDILTTGDVYTPAMEEGISTDYLDPDTNATRYLAVVGVYATEDLTGTNYLAATGAVDIAGKRLAVQSGLTPGGKAWIRYEARSPIVGPLPVQLSDLAGLIPDVQVFDDYESNPSALLLDDQKNGWISDNPADDNNPDRRSILVQKGVATLNNLPNSGYVTPENPSVIASVEGVYRSLDAALKAGIDPNWTPEDGEDTTNYYDIGRLDQYPVIMQTWRINSGGMSLSPITGLLPSDAAWSDASRIPSDSSAIPPRRGIRGVFELWDSGMAGPNYWAEDPSLLHPLAPPNPSKWQQAIVWGSKDVWLTDPDNVATIEGVYEYINDNGTNYYDPDILLSWNWPSYETLYLGTALPPTVGSIVYVKYHDLGFVDNTVNPPVIHLRELAPAGQTQMLVAVRPDTYKAGDSAIRTTYDLPILLAKPDKPNLIASLEGIYLTQAKDGFNYYNPATANPVYHTGEAYVYPTTPLPIYGARVYLSYRDSGGNLQTQTAMVTAKTGSDDLTVYIRYSHIQFTHQIRGQGASQYSQSGMTHFVPDGVTMPNGNIVDLTPPDGSRASINSNIDDPTAGMVGVWLDANRSGTNHLDPRRTSRLGDDPSYIRLSTPLSEGTTYAWARVYQNGDYFVDRWNREAVLLSTPRDANKLQASYFFGTKMPATLGSNNPPSLQKADPTKECISQISGSRTTQFIFTIKYTDTDGPNGQAPAYVRVYIDGQPYDMTPVSTGGTPAYNVGAVYTYTATGLSGASHKYHFECSDGAAMAWFDANGGHQSYVGSIVDPITDMDGPWVNNPPTLTVGQANPSGNIGTNQSVDYTVLYTDVDGNPPYFYELTDLDQDGQPVGADVDGSPRVWVDSAATDVAYSGTVGSLEYDPLDPTKRRKIIVSDASDWTADQFAGKLMQITNGAAKDRVYLIQSSTENSLTIATDDLSADGIVTGSKFRIGGMLMSKADPSQQDFTQGVLYKITIPRLAVGTHKYHFTARSREDKPEWLRVMMIAQGQTPLPYSSAVRFPAAGELNGPTVVSSAPPGNVAPVISNSSDTSLYLGPKVMSASVASATVVDPGSSLQLRSVQGVYLNASEAYAGSGTSYYNPNTTLNPFTPGDLSITLAPALPAIHTTDTLIQVGRPAALSSGVSDLWNVIPDAADRIGELLGVYLLSDTAMLTNYYDPAAANPVFATGAAQIGLTTRLPSGTERVYVKYKPATITQSGTANGLSQVDLLDAAAVADVLGVYLTTDTEMTGVNYYDPATASPAFVPGDSSLALTTDLPAGTASVTVKYVPWPPVYVRNFAQPPSTGMYLSGDPLTFRLGYRDADNDPPTYHDGVQGYIRVAFNTGGRTSALLPLTPPITDYTVNNLFSATFTDVPEGSQKYHFEASDGYFPVRWPLLGSGGSTSGDYSLKVNYKPVIKSGTVDHTSGATTFTFTATYQDRDNIAPAAGAGYVVVRLTQVEDPKIEYVKALTTSVTNPVYSTGVAYGAIVGEGTALEPGHYSTVFEAHDGIQAAVPLVGPSIIVRDTNSAPIIKSFSVSPSAGKTGITFTYSGFYRDRDGDAPVALSGGRRVEGLTLIIDKGTAGEKQLLMTRVPLPTPPPPAPPPVPDFTAVGGVEYRVTQSGRQLGAGQHTYLVIGSDGTDDTTEVMTGTVDGNGTDVTPDTTSIIESVVGVFTDSDMAGTNYYLPSGTLSEGKIHLGQSLAGGTGVYIRYNRVPKSGPVLMIPYFDLSVVTKDGASVSDRTVVGEEVLIEGKVYFPYNLESGIPSPFDDVTINVTKPDGASLALNARVESIAVDDPSSPQNWFGDLIVRYDGYVDAALATGNSLTLTASGLWKIGAVWPGDPQWDRAETDTTIDGRNDIVQISVSGPSRTLAVSDPYNPDTSNMLLDMITPPMVIGSTDPGVVFGYDRALGLRIVRWVPSSSAYFSYGVSGVFPPLMPGDAMWIKPSSTYPAAEPLGLKAVQRGNVLALNRIQLTQADTTAYVAGVYTKQDLSETNYYDPSTSASPFRFGDETVTLTSNLPADTTEVWVDYVVWPLSGVDEGWIALDNPTMAKAIDDGEPRYYHTKYRLVKALSKAYPIQTDALGNRILDPATRLPLLKSCQVSLKTGWNQFGNIFFNWRKKTQKGTRDALLPLTQLVPTLPNEIGKVLGVYLTPSLGGTNYYVPGLASQPYQRGSAAINLTTPLPAGTLEAYVKYEMYPREDVGIPISEVRVNYLGQSKLLSEAKAAGWINDYAWHWDANQRNYVRVHATSAGAERTLKAWSGYWIKTFVDCQLEINPNTSYNGSVSGLTAGLTRETAADERFEAPPPAPE